MTQGSYALPTWFRKAEKKITDDSRCNESEIDFSMIGKVDRMVLKNINWVANQLQHNLVVADVGKKHIIKAK